MNTLPGIRQGLVDNLREVMGTTGTKRAILLEHEPKIPQMAKSRLDKPPPVAVALLDTHWLIREALALWLKECAGYRVAWKGGTRAELEKALDDGLKVDLVVVAVAIHEDEGHLAVKWLKEEWPALFCAAYAHRHDEVTMLRVYRKGAQVFFHDTVKGDAVLCGLNTALVGAVFHSAVSQQLFLENPDGLTQADRNRENLRKKVSPKQLEVLEGTVRYAGYSETRMAKQMRMNPATLHSHLMDLYLIFGVNSRAALSVAAIRVGLVRV